MSSSVDALEGRPTPCFPLDSRAAFWYRREHCVQDVQKQHNPSASSVPKPFSLCCCRRWHVCLQRCPISHPLMLHLVLPRLNAIFYLVVGGIQWRQSEGNATVTQNHKQRMRAVTRAILTRFATHHSLFSWRACRLLGCQRQRDAAKAWHQWLRESRGPSVGRRSHH